MQTGKQHPPRFPESRWYSKNVEEVISELESSPKGLSEAEAKHRLTSCGPNELTKVPSTSPVSLFLAQFKSFLIVILLLAAGISIATGDTFEAITIIAIVVLAGVLGFVQEFRADKAIEELRKIAAPTVSVIRDGEEKIIPSRELVVGDILSLKTGDRIAADGRLIEAVNLRVDEAALTGESHPVEKTYAALEGERVALGDRRNMVYAGTIVSHGRGKAIVTATGMGTELGKITGLIQETESERTPLQVNLDQMGRWIGILALLLSIVIAFFGIFRGHDVIEMLIWGIALAVAVIPEALPAVVTISLALGVRRLVKRNALIRKLAAVETLGATSVICSDKTGTLTQGEMTVQVVVLPEREYRLTEIGYKPQGRFLLRDATNLQQYTQVDPTNDADLQILLRSATLCNDAELREVNGSWKIFGDSTEGALLTMAAKAGITKCSLQEQEPRIDEIAFSSERKIMTTIHQRSDGTYIAYMKGALEILLRHCVSYQLDGEHVPLTTSDRHRFIVQSSQIAREGLRTLGFAYRTLSSEEYSLLRADGKQGDIERDMVFLGFVGMMDPPREEVKEAIRRCKEARIKPVMITGDHKYTAEAVARQLGILTDGIILSGEELDAMPIVLSGDQINKIDQQTLESIVEQVEVYARVAPEHKLRVVDAFTKKGKIVAMTGDGVNDAPALKRAHIGIAMGITGTDVSKEASAMVLLDDNFASIVAAVEEGRAIFSNIRKYLVFLLSGNLGTVIAMVVALLANLPLPLAAVQILFVNMILDGLPAIALSVEPPEQGLMKQPPRDPKKSIFDRHSLFYIPAVGLLIAAVTVGVFWWTLSSSDPRHVKAMTMFLSTLVSARLFNSLNCRSPKGSIFQIGWFTNRWLLLGIASALLLTLLVIYVPILNVPFMTTALSLKEWLISVAAGSIVWIVVEIAKSIYRWVTRHQHSRTS